MHSHCPLEEHDVLRRRCESQNESPSDAAEKQRKDDEIFMLVQSRSRALLRPLCADARGAEIAKLRVALRVLVGSDESQPKSIWGSYTAEVADILQACHTDANDAAVVEVETIGGEALGRAAAAAVGIGRALKNIAPDSRCVGERHVEHQRQCRSPARHWLASKFGLALS